MICIRSFPAIWRRSKAPFLNTNGWMVGRPIRRLRARSISSRLQRERILIESSLLSRRRSLTSVSALAAIRSSRLLSAHNCLLDAETAETETAVGHEATKIGNCEELQTLCLTCRSHGIGPDVILKKATHNFLSFFVYFFVPSCLRDQPAVGVSAVSAVSASNGSLRHEKNQPRRGKSASFNYI
jgi:hypothetical protein